LDKGTISGIHQLFLLSMKDHTRQNTCFQIVLGTMRVHIASPRIGKIDQYVFWHDSSFQE